MYKKYVALIAVVFTAALALLVMSPAPAIACDYQKCVPACCIGDRGDASGNGYFDIWDLYYLVGYLYEAGDPPPCMEEADVNFDCVVDLGDVTFLVAYFYSSGPPPGQCDPCDLGGGGGD